jgi:hypothetical protein
MIEKLYSLYFSFPRPSFLGILNKVVDRSMSFVLKRLMDNLGVTSLKKTAVRSGYGLNKEPREQEYIVSLTSFPGRIDEVWITIETLLRQTFKPDCIILWLSEVQFPDRKIPNSLEKLKDRGLTVEFVPDDIRSHKKYFYAFQRYPEAIVITVDDDVFYPKNTLLYLAEMYIKFPNSVGANRAHTMTFLDGNVKAYRQWLHNDKVTLNPNYLLVPTGVGGVLYPPHAYHEDIFDEKVFKEICFMADDLWLKVATLRQQKKVVTSPFFTRDLITTGKTQQIKLVADNSHGGGNDNQFKDVCDYYHINLKSLCS